MELELENNKNSKRSNHQKWLLNTLRNKCQNKYRIQIRWTWGHIQWILTKWILKCTSTRGCKPRHKRKHNLRCQKQCLETSSIRREQDPNFSRCKKWVCRTTLRSITNSCRPNKARNKAQCQTTLTPVTTHRIWWWVTTCNKWVHLGPRKRRRNLEDSNLSNKLKCTIPTGPIWCNNNSNNRGPEQRVSKDLLFLWITR